MRVPPSKSLTHRALILSALAGDGVVENPLWSEDTLATRSSLAAMGIAIEGDDPVRIQGQLRPGRGVLDCRNSGTTLRLLTGVAATLSGTTRLTGDESLRQRPMGPLLDALAAAGAVVESQGGRAPVKVTGPLIGGTVHLPGGVSSQFVSSLILAGLRSREGLRIVVEGPRVSEPYIVLTLDGVRRLCGTVQESATGYEVTPSALKPARFRVEADWSTAAFPLGLGALGGPVTVAGLDPESRQGDRSVLDHLEAMGCRVVWHGDGVTVGGGDLAGCDIDLKDSPDLFPLLAALACHAQGETLFTGAAHLRYKESDRIAAMVKGIRALGGLAEETQDGALVRGEGLRGGLVETFGDHRILMAFAVAGSAARGPVELSEAESFSVSYPSFLDDLKQLGIRWAIK